MFVGRVVGAAVSTVKDERLVGWKLLVVQPLEMLIAQDESTGNVPRVLVREAENPVVAIDSVGAGVGELVLVTSGSSARASTAPTRSPVDASIVGIVDTLDATVGAGATPAARKSDESRSESS